MRFIINIRNADIETIVKSPVSLWIGYCCCGCVGGRNFHQAKKSIKRIKTFCKLKERSVFSLFVNEKMEKIKFPTGVLNQHCKTANFKLNGANGFDGLDGRFYFKLREKNFSFICFFDFGMDCFVCRRGFIGGEIRRIL